MNKADQLAMKKILSVVPAWTRVVSAKEAIGLADCSLLHCGPPAKPMNDLVTPILNSAAVACVFEGWAPNLDEADKMISAGEIEFLAAQDYNVVTPMAAVVSSSMKLTEFSDLNNAGHQSWAPLNGGGTGADPVPRYGYKSQAAIDFLKFLNQEVGDAIADVPSLSPVQWLPIIDEALIKGDDGHLRHLEAHKLLLSTIVECLGEEFSRTDTYEFIKKWPFFHLNFWMAASKLILSAAADVNNSGIISAFGGNGNLFGFKIGAFKDRWFTCPATPPLGKIREPHTLETCVGAFGDSAITEGLGLGAMAQIFCPDMQELHKEYTPADIFELPGKLLMSEHPGMPMSKARVGLSVRAIIDNDLTPILELGIADKHGFNGGLGAGIFRPTIEPFLEAGRLLE